MAKKSYTNKELKHKLVNAIERMDAILTSDEKDAHKNVQAANAMAGLVKRYKELFDVGMEEYQPKMKSVKNF